MTEPTTYKKLGIFDTVSIDIGDLGKGILVPEVGEIRCYSVVDRYDPTVLVVPSDRSVLKSVISYTLHRREIKRAILDKEENKNPRILFYPFF